MTARTSLLIATRKGLWILDGDDRTDDRAGTSRSDSADIARLATWIDIGQGMPKDAGNIGFPMTLDPKDPERAWVFPMDGSDVWPRTSPDGKPAVFRTDDGGTSWRRQDNGFPSDQAWWTVKRQAMTADGHAQLGLYFGTTSGEIWGSIDEGESWKCLARGLPHIYAVEAAAFG